jgi:hypothetical protein
MQLSLPHGVLIQLRIFVARAVDRIQKAPVLCRSSARAVTVHISDSVTGARSLPQTTAVARNIQNLAGTTELQLTLPRRFSNVGCVSANTFFPPEF